MSNTPPAIIVSWLESNMAIVYSCACTCVLPKSDPSQSMMQTTHGCRAHHRQMLQQSAMPTYSSTRVMWQKNDVGTECARLEGEVRRRHDGAAWGQRCTRHALLATFASHVCAQTVDQERLAATCRAHEYDDVHGPDGTRRERRSRFGADNKCRLKQLTL